MYPKIFVVLWKLLFAGSLSRCPRVKQWHLGGLQVFKLEGTPCLVLCSSNVIKVASLFPWRVHLCPWWHLALGRKDLTYSKNPRGYYSLPNDNINLPGFNLQRLSLLPSSLQNHAEKEGKGKATYWKADMQSRVELLSQSEFKTQKESQLSKPPISRGDSDNSLLCQRLHNQKHVTGWEVIISTQHTRQGVEEAGARKRGRNRNRKNIPENICVAVMGKRKRCKDAKLV